jgi:hypothetical protein
MTDSGASLLSDVALPLSHVEHDDGTVEYDFGDENGDPTLEDGQPKPEDATDHYDNLADYLDDVELKIIANEVWEGYEEDEESRAGHIATITDAISSLGISDREAITPFEGACTVYHPLLIENAVKLQAKASSELLPANGPVKTEILGDASPAQELQADRVRTHMNWQVTKQMPEFTSNSEKGLLPRLFIGRRIQSQVV